MSSSDLQFPTSPGSYLLILYLRRRTLITIGRLGTFSFQRGWYCYAGSAFGPGGLKARLGHHLKTINCYHWHIDYLRTVAELRSVWYVEGADKEHSWSTALARLESAELPIRGFGSSDCDCLSHLVYLPCRPAQRTFRALLGNMAGHEPVD